MTNIYIDHIDEQWRAQQVVAILYKNARGAMVGSMANIAIVSYVLADIYPTVGLLIWFVFGEGLNLIRWYVHHLYIRVPDSRSTQSWLFLHRAFTFVSGSLYGISAIFFFSSEYPLYQALVIFLVGGMGAAAVGTHSADLVTYRLFLFSAVIPLVIRSLQEGTEVHTTLATMLCLLMIIMLRSAKQSRDIMLENIDMTQSLHYRATHDGLVGLLNRDEFHNMYLKDAATVQQTGIIKSMIFIDLDNFKNLNDTCGHQEGDKALIKIGDIIRSSIRKSDFAARFGGDEFMIMIKSDSIAEAQFVARKILTKIYQFQNESNHATLKLGASVGIGYSLDPTVSYESLLKAADQACYQAKRDNKGSICLLEAI